MLNLPKILPQHSLCFFHAFNQNIDFFKRIVNSETRTNRSCDIEKFHNEGNCFLITVGQIKSAQLRKKLFERLSTKIGFKVTPHMLRHGRGTELHEAGWNKSEIKELLRHRSATSTDRYIHITEERMREALEIRYKGINLSFGNQNE